MTKHSKRYNSLAEKVAPAVDGVGLGEAAVLVKECGNTKFDQSVDVAVADRCARSRHPPPGV